jgi:hypothetical protein
VATRSGRSSSWWQCPDQIDRYFVPDAAGSGVVHLPSHSILQLGRALCRTATEAGVTLVALTVSLPRVCIPSYSGDRSG